MNIARIFLPEHHGGGFISLKCTQEDTAQDLVRNAVEKIKAKRLREQLTGDVDLSMVRYTTRALPRTQSLAA